jgi:hypothetical protein
MAVSVVQARPRVRKSLRQLDPVTRKDVLAAMRALADDPRPAGATALKGHLMSAASAGSA